MSLHIKDCKMDIYRYWEVCADQDADETEDRTIDCSLTKDRNKKPCSCVVLHGFLISTFSVRAL